jgi:hypothetical protein
LRAKTTGCAVIAPQSLKNQLWRKDATDAGHRTYNGATLGDINDNGEAAALLPATVSEHGLKVNSVTQSGLKRAANP